MRWVSAIQYMSISSADVTRSFSGPGVRNCRTPLTLEVDDILNEKAYFSVPERFGSGSLFTSTERYDL
ncbi:hypothetical protein OPQ81_007154 [Rhizoctonia solani]|nr:hypothetical protein OPQ81_007154 [Rhizoctonia solani]